MLFRRLMENNSRASILIVAEGYAISLVAHVLIIVGTLYAARGVASREIADSFSPVAFFYPKDQLKGMRPKQERISYMSVEAQGGGGSAAPEPKVPVQQPQPSETGVGLEEMSSQLSQDNAPSETPGDSVMTVLQVDTAVARYDDSAAPPYPRAMLEKHIEGTVAIQYIVDTTGFADTTSIVVLAASHPDFASSVRKTLPLMRFRPAVMNARKVRQLVQQMFSFRIDTTLSPKPELAKP
ncbi:MAG: energy transducer TonB [Gemmatimonadaceae bacterium]